MSTRFSIGVVMDPIEHISYYKDTTLALLLAAQERGHNLVYMELSDLFLSESKAQANMRQLVVYDNKSHWFDLQAPYMGELGALDVILMRKDPPFDNQYIYATYILEQAEAAGTLVVNKPQSLRDCNEKIFATQFPQCCPPLLVSRDRERLRAFHAEQGEVIFKPLDGMGGAGVFHCRDNDPNVNVILETLTNYGAGFIMAQRYLPEIRSGDKRVLVVDGEAIPYCLARVPVGRESRGNLAAGGKGVAQPLSERDQWIVDQVAPTLKAKGLYFVGLDIIGDYLTEINVTSPTCVREIDRAFDTRIGEQLMITIETLREGAGA